MPTDPAADPYDLQRFLDAQSTTWQQARAELAAGQKRSHWMWFIFPQLRGLGSSLTAQQYGIADLGEAVACLQHPILGPRLREATTLVNAIPNRSIEQIFGYPDNLKFHSSVTLFAEAASHAQHTDLDNVFLEALTLHFDGLRDGATLNRLKLQ